MGGASRVLDFLSPSYECWNVDKLEGIGDGPTELNNPPYRLILDYIGNFSNLLPDNYFDFVFSISVLEHVPEDDKGYFDSIVDDINRVLKPGGYSLHLVDVLVHEKGVWCHKLVYHIFDNAKTINRITPFNEMIGDPDLYCMSEAAYNRKWAPILKKSYKELGRPSSLNILWRKE